MNKTIRILIFVTVFATVAAGVTYAVKIYPMQVQDDKDTAAAKRMGIDPQKYLLDTHFIAERVKNLPITDSDWHDVMTLYNDSNPFFHRDAFHLMTFMKKSAYEKKVVELAKKECDTPNGSGKGTSLLILWRFSDPSWRSMANALANDSDSEVKKDAQFTLEKGDRL